MNAQEEFNKASPLSWVRLIRDVVNGIGLGNIIVIVFIGMITGYVPSPIIEQNRQLLQEQIKQHKEILGTYYNQYEKLNNYHKETHLDLREMNSLLDTHVTNTSGIADIQRAICLNAAKGDTQKERCYEGIER